MCQTSLVARGFRAVVSVVLASLLAFAPSASWAAIRVLGEAELVDPQPDPKQPDKPVSPYKNIAAYMERVQARPKVQEAMKAEGLIQ